MLAFGQKLSLLARTHIFFTAEFYTLISLSARQGLPSTTVLTPAACSLFPSWLVGSLPQSQP